MKMSLSLHKPKVLPLEIGAASMASMYLRGHHRLYCDVWHVHPQTKTEASQYHVRCPQYSPGVDSERG